MANETLLSKVPIPEDHIHRMRGEIDPNEAAKEYGQILKARFGEGGLDLILLGMGDDGHTASLFPETAALAQSKHRCVANFVPKLQTWRITLAAPFINRANEALFLVSGEKKAPLVKQVLESQDVSARFPAQMIQPIRGRLIWLLDSDAADMQADE